jgi:hypothetical protein
VKLSKYIGLVLEKNKKIKIADIGAVDTTKTIINKDFKKYTNIGDNNTNNNDRNEDVLSVNNYFNKKNNNSNNNKNSKKKLKKNKNQKK